MVERVLLYWFGDLRTPTDYDGSKYAMWWDGGDAVDREIQSRFGELVARTLDGQHRDWMSTPRGALARIIVLDQFTRNIGRGTAAAFVGDALALETCRQTLAVEHDRQLRCIERWFCYIPLMHAEDVAIAEQSIAAFAQLSEDVAALGADAYPDPYQYAVEHAEIVRRFGRYPHRNALLGRESTPQELQFLRDGGPTYGQDPR